MPSTSVRASSASKIISNWVTSGLAHARKMVSVVSTGLTPHTRLETEGPLLLDSEDEEEEKQAVGEGMRQQTVMSQQERQLGQVEKRGRGRPANRPLDLPSTKPLRRASSSSADSEHSQQRPRPKQSRMDQYLSQSKPAG